MLNNMTPGPTLQNTVDRNLGDSVADGQFSYFDTFGVREPNVAHGIFRKFGQMARRASTKPSFVEAVLHVVGIGSQKQVVGIHASRIVAMVQYVKSIGYGAKVNHPRSSVRKDVLDDVFLSLAPKGNATISVGVIVPCPNPARRILSDVSPKPFVKRSIFMRLITRLAAELTSVAAKWGKYASAF